MNNNQSTGGAGFFVLLGVLFIALKLTNVITWSWVWVLAPLWGPFVALFILLIVVLVLSLSNSK